MLLAIGRRAKIRAHGASSFAACRYFVFARGALRLEMPVSSQSLALWGMRALLPVALRSFARRAQVECPQVSFVVLDGCGAIRLRTLGSARLRDCLQGEMIPLRCTMGNHAPGYGCVAGAMMAFWFDGLCGCFLWGEEGTMACVNVNAEYVLSHMGKEPIVDLRPAFMYDAEHIPGAKNIDFWSYASQDSPGMSVRLAALLDEMGVGKADPVILHCAVGMTSATACAMLIEQGFTELRHYVGGYDDWTSDSFRPVE